MMTTQLSVKEILDWYIAAGVDATCGEEPFGLSSSEGKINIDIKNSEKTNEKNIYQTSQSVVRPATTALAQVTNSACQNAKDLCASITSLEELREAVENFEGCALKLTAAHTVFGGGNPQSKIMFVGEAPGADEDRIGIPFVGRSGHLLDKMLASIGLDRENCYICNILPWRPPGNRTPLDSEVAVCLPFLKKQIDIISPDYIITLGGSAANALLDINESISHLRGKWMEYQKSDGKTAKVLASFHPAYLLRSPGQKAKSWADFLRLYKEINL